MVLATAVLGSGAHADGDQTPVRGAAAASVATEATPPLTSNENVSTSDQSLAVPDALPRVDNIVFVLADDLDWQTFNEVPRLAALLCRGLTFRNTVVTDSFCCPSRMSILRGQYIHNHEGVSNRAGSGGGWPTFHDSGAEADCLPVWLDQAGVRTALIGKYLNEYTNGADDPAFIPPGWDQWFVPVSQARRTGAAATR